MKRYLIIAGLGSYLMLAAADAQAHHAFAAMYDAQKAVKLRGTVAKVEWINPHSWIHIDVKRNDGKVETWIIEAANPATLLERGYSKDSLKVGTEVSVDGYQAKDGSLHVHGRELAINNGPPLFLG